MTGPDRAAHDRLAATVLPPAIEVVTACSRPEVLQTVRRRYLGEAGP